MNQLEQVRQMCMAIAQKHAHVGVIRSLEASSRANTAKLIAADIAAAELPVPATLNEVDTRASFEAWVREFYNEKSLSKKDGQYIYQNIYNNWTVWQAAAAHFATKQPSGLFDYIPALRKCAVNIAYDNGMVNADTTEAAVLRDMCLLLLRGVPAELILEAERYLATRSDEQLNDICCGEDAQREDCPAVVNKSLNVMFGEES